VVGIHGDFSVSKTGGLLEFKATERSACSEANGLSTRKLLVMPEWVPVAARPPQSGLIHWGPAGTWCYNSVRQHQGIENRPIGVIPFPGGTEPPDPGEKECEARLGVCCGTTTTGGTFLERDPV